MKVAVKALFVFGVAVALLATGYWVGGKKSESIAEIPNCHPPLADLAPDGNMFAALTPDKLEVTVSPFNTDKKPWVIKLARPASDIIAISNQAILVSYGTTGEVALLNIEGGQPEQLIKVGSFAGDMCRSAAKQAFVSDPASGKVYQFDLATKSVIHAYSVKGKPSQMKWRVPDAELEVFGEKGKSLGTLNVTTKVTG
ncbi:MAG: hypothetical protein GC149_11755 [Gammaproteobacteria bacterium]|nr:hypothetical protein [Gammaproteobacteria bacterium]